MKILYKRTKTGASQQWQIFVKGDSFWTEEGQVGGVITRSKPTVCEPKNVGRANATTAEEQAVLEAQSKYQKKLDKGYFESLDDISKGPAFYEPMLAQKFEDYRDGVAWPVFVQPKLDGIRAVITKNGATTRNGKPHMAIPHILKALEPFFDKFPDAILDGELYNHDLHDDFNKIASLVRKTKPTENDLRESAQMVLFYCYDAPRIDDLTEKDAFYLRYGTLFKTLPIAKELVVVSTVPTASFEELKKHHESFVEMGYEGIIVRVPESPYENKRSKFLLKYKVFDDDEFVIEGVLEGKGNRAGTVGGVELTSKSGNYFTSNIKAPVETLKKMWDNSGSFIGKTVTVRYFGLTPDKEIPRFPYVVDIDRWIHE